MVSIKKPKRSHFKTDHNYLTALREYASRHPAGEAAAMRMYDKADAYKQSGLTGRAKRRKELFSNPVLAKEYRKEQGEKRNAKKKADDKCIVVTLILNRQQETDKGGYAYAVYTNRNKDVGYRALFTVGRLKNMAKHGLAIKGNVDRDMSIVITATLKSMVGMVQFNEGSR